MRGCWRCCCCCEQFMALRSVGDARFILDLRYVNYHQQLLCRRLQDGRPAEVPSAREGMSMTVPFLDLKAAYIECQTEITRPYSRSCIADITSAAPKWRRSKPNMHSFTVPPSAGAWSTGLTQRTWHCASWMWNLATKSLCQPTRLLRPDSPLLNAERPVAPVEPGARTFNITRALIASGVRAFKQ